MPSMSTRFDHSRMKIPGAWSWEPDEDQSERSETEVTIAVMGATGSGKTTFVNLVSGSDLRIGSGLESCTNVIQASLPFTLAGRQVVLIDTPGFDDTSTGDTDILKMIALYLSASYECHKKLAGVLYFHRISDYRVGGIARRNFNMFLGLCGDTSLKNVAIVTNMWGEVKLEVGEKREKELVSGEKFFKPAIEKGGRILRHDNGMKSARAILLHLVQNTPMPLRIQEELVDQNKDISETTAGVELNRQFIEQAKRHKKAMEDLQEEMKAAIQERDEQARKALEEHQEKLLEEMARLQRDSQMLAEGFKKDKASMEKQMRKVKELADHAETEHQKQVRTLHDELLQTAAKSTEENARIMQQLEKMKQGGDGPSTGTIIVKTLVEAAVQIYLRRMLSG